MPGIGLERGVGALAAIVADRDAGRAVEDQDLALAAELLDQPLGGRVAPLVGIGVDLGGDLVGVDEAVEIDDGDALGAGVGDDAGGRGRRAGDQDDGVDIGVDHRLDLLDLGVGVALGVGDDQLVDEALLLQLLDLCLDRALGLLHPGRHRIDVGPADRVGRLAVALDAVGGGIGLCGQADAGDEAEAEGPDGRPER